MDPPGCRPRNTRLSCRKRVAAEMKKKPASKDPDNCFKKVMTRELTQQANWTFKRCASQEKFKNFNLQEVFDTHDPRCPQFQRLQFLRRRSRIVEITAARDLVFTLSHSGVCAAFSRETNKRICYLNLSTEEVIRSLFYNKNNESIITVSVYSSDDFSTLRCRTTSLEYIKRGAPDAGFPLFESECLKWPGFVEFDDVNGKVLTYSAYKKTYKVYDLKNYTHLYSIKDENITEIKISPGVMLVIGGKKDFSVPLRVINIENGELLKTVDYAMKRSKVEFIEQFNEKVLIKQEQENLQILDICTNRILDVCKTDFMTPTAFIFLYESQLFLTFRMQTVGVWNFKGELVTEFEDHLLWHPDCNTSNIYITSDQDLIISYCRNTPSAEEANPEGSINVSNILTGKLLWKISASNLTKSGLKLNPKLADVSIEEALENVTALFYDEERNEIYTGTRSGYLHVWSN